MTVSSDGAGVSVLVSGNGTAAESHAVHGRAGRAEVIDRPAEPGDPATIKAKVTTPTGPPDRLLPVEHRGPGPQQRHVDTGTIDKLLQRIGLNDTTLWVWAVDDLGTSATPPRGSTSGVPDPAAPRDTTPGDLMLGWVHIRSSSCIRPDADGNDFVVPLTDGGASINGLEVSCPASGTCGTITIKHTDASSEPLKPGDTRAFRLRSTAPVKLTWPNGQKGPSSSATRPSTSTMPAGRPPRRRPGAPRGARSESELRPRRRRRSPCRDRSSSSTSTPSAGHARSARSPTTGTVSLSVYGPDVLGGEPGMKLTANVKVRPRVDARRRTRRPGGRRGHRAHTPTATTGRSTSAASGSCRCSTSRTCS